MAQLLKITTVPYEAMRFTQNARLIRSDSVEIERRKVLARHNAFRARYSKSNTIDYNYVSQINRTFSSKNHAASSLSSVSATAKQQVTPNTIQAEHVVSPNNNSNAITSQIPVSLSEQSVQSTTSSVSKEAITAESQANYNAQLGAFELRVAKGELSYLPPMVMTIITQRPDVQFEYLGDFNYVPPDWNGNMGSNVNFSI